MVEQLPHNPKLEGSNPVSVTRARKWGKSKRKIFPFTIFSPLVTLTGFEPSILGLGGNCLTTVLLLLHVKREVDEMTKRQ